MESSMAKPINSDRACCNEFALQHAPGAHAEEHLQQHGPQQFLGRYVAITDRVLQSAHVLRYC